MKLVIVMLLCKPFVASLNTKVKRVLLALVHMFLPLYFAQFKKKVTAEHAKITQGSVNEFHYFSSPVINKFAFDKIKIFIDHAAVDDNYEIIAGGKRDDSTGYFIKPTVIVTKDKLTKTMNDEIFGPVVTIYVYKDAEFDQTCKLVGEATKYGLTGAFLTKDRDSIVKRSNLLFNTAGNSYTNDRCGSAIVDQQPFCGRCVSGTISFITQPLFFILFNHDQWS